MKDVGLNPVGPIGEHWRRGVVFALLLMPLSFHPGRAWSGQPQDPKPPAAPAKIEPKKRPQEPTRPFPYAEDLVTYENKKAGVKLAATLTLPRGAGPFPAVLLITGSGPQDRDETVAGHKPFLVLA